MHNFVESLLALSPNNLRFISALFSEISPSNAITDTVSDLASGLRGTQKAQDAFLQRVARTAKARQDLQFDAVLFDSLLGMLDALELEKIELGTEAGLANLNERIEAKAIELYRANNNRFAGETVDEFYQAQLTELLDDMRIVYIEMPDEQQQTTIQQILAYFAALSEAQQELVCKALDTPTLTAEVLHAALLKRILVRVFIEEVGLSNLVGQQSALLSDSLVIAALLGEEGKKLIRTQNRQLQQRVLPIIVALVLLGEPDPKPIEQRRAALIERWRALFGEYRKEEQWHSKIQADLRQAEENLDEVKAKKKALDADLREENSRYNQLVKLVAEHLATERSFLEELAEQGPLANQAQQYLALDDKTAERELQKRQELAEETTKKSSFLGKAWTKVKSLGGSVVKVKDQKVMSNMLQGIARDLLTTKLSQEPEWLAPFMKQALTLQESTSNLQQQSQTTQAELDKAERLRSELQSAVNQSRDRLKTMNKDYPALAEGTPWPEETETTAEQHDPAVEVQPETEPLPVDAPQTEVAPEDAQSSTPVQEEPATDGAAEEQVIIDSPGDVCG